MATGRADLVKPTQRGDNNTTRTEKERDMATTCGGPRRALVVARSTYPYVVTGIAIAAAGNVAGHSVVRGRSVAGGSAGLR